MEQPQVDSNDDVMTRLGNFLVPPEPAEAAPANEQPQPQEEAPQTEDAQTQEAPPEDDGFVDLELEDGETVRVPPKLRDGYLRQSDYTRKTQEVAQLQKQALAASQNQLLIQEFNKATREEQSRLSQIQAQLNQAKSLDWSNLDTETYIKTRGYLDQLKDEASTIEKSLGEKANEVKQHIAKSRSTAAQNAYEYIQRHVKDWKPDSETEKDVAKYAGNYGVPPEALAEISVMFPGFAVMAAKASQFDKLQSGSKQAVQKAQKAPPVVKPGVAGTGNAARQADQKIRAQFKKSGDVNDLARVLLSRGLVK